MDLNNGKHNWVLGLNVKHTCECICVEGEGGECRERLKKSLAHSSETA